MAAAPEWDSRLVAAAWRATELIPNQRDREIVEHRFGRHGKRETLNEVGLRFNLTRERIRQVEAEAIKALSGALIASPVPEVDAAMAQLVKTLDDMGQAATVDALAGQLVGHSAEAQGAVILLAELSPHLVVMPGNAHYYPAIVHSETLDKRALRRQIDTIVAALRQRGAPVALDQWAGLVDAPGSPSEIAAIAGLSKEIIRRDDQWGLPKWAVMNPHNIRDLSYILLTRAGTPMHFSAIADAVNAGLLGCNHFSQKVVHNGLIKDPRFVLIGRGTYALAEWGYQKGSLSDVIAGVLREESPLTSDEIVRRVMLERQLQDRTIRLSLHSRPQFKRVAKTQYVLDESAISVK